MKIDDIFNSNNDNNLPPEEEGFWSPSKDEEEDCPMINKIISLGLMPKPFGCTWSRKQMMDFLKARGYRVLTRFDEKTEEDYYVVAKKDDISIPDDGTSNLLEVFVEEIQGILLRWLLKLDKQD